ncbi:LysR family transcriptional regulator [Paraburkholderia youngii]|uniref:LysR family transcriptional regulator n=1 Tax=Paraburkholderia youngii TaxID=2782701 RepID=UPI0015925A9C|nr:LysR family transcriptional regulator [Paraburkholderia youngii]NUX53804.1 LysR family transcriptional regulator [Paraburkholderia youngii]
MPEIRNLQPFVQAVRCGSFIAAATRLQVTPPAVSKSIAALERELGVRLFNRTTRKLSLTSEGRQFFQRVAPLLSQLDEAVADVRRSPEHPEGVIKVSVTPTFGRHCLTPVIAAFLQRYPLVEIDISYDEVAPSLVNDGVDVSIQHARGRGTNHVSRPLCDYPIVLVASQDYLERKGVPQSPDQLAAHDFIGIRMPFGLAALHLERLPGGTRKRTNRGEKAFIHHPRGRLTVAGQPDTSLIAALSGAGITPSSVPVVLPYLHSGALKIVLPDYRVRGDEAEGAGPRIYVHYPHRQYLPAKVRVFVDYLLERFRTTDFGKAQLDRYSA